MLSLLVAWLISGSIFLVFGKLLVDIFRVFYPEKASCSVFDCFFLGICTVGSLISIQSIWYPVNSYTGLILFVLAIAYFSFSAFWNKDRFWVNFTSSIKGQSLSVKLLALFVLLTILVYSSLPPLVFDMGLYYLQSILWNESYPVVPGLANIHGRLGFNSNILLLSSALSLSDIFSFRVYPVLGLSTWVLILWILVKMRAGKSLIQKLALVCTSFAFLYIYTPFISSPSTDVLPNILVLYILLKAILEPETLKNNLLPFFLIPIYALTLKLSVAPLCLFCIYLLVKEVKTGMYKECFTLILLGLFILIPWLVRNVLLSGYLIYPFPSLDIFGFDWKVLSYLADIEKREVTTWARMPGLGYLETEQMGFFDWGKYWLVRHIKMHKLILFSCILAGISPLAIFYMWKKKLIDSFVHLFVWGIALGGAIFWFVLAPDARFGFSFILVTALSPLLLCEKVKVKTNIHFIVLATFISFIFINGVEQNQVYRGNKTLQSYLYAPQQMEIMDKARNTVFKDYEVDNLTFFYPDNMLCSDHALPCVPFYDDKVEMRGATITDGFRKKNNINIE